MGKGELANVHQDFEKDSRLGHGFWRGRVVWAGHGAHASLYYGPGSRSGLGMVAEGDVLGKGFVNGGQGFGARGS